MELKPCPFCGCKQTIEDIAQDGIPGYMLQHMCCMIRPSWLTIKEEAIKAWNTRSERLCVYMGRAPIGELCGAALEVVSLGCGHMVIDEAGRTPATACSAGQGW